MTVPRNLVLLVEDEPIVRLDTAQGLEDAGFEVVEADNADAALAILKSRSDVGVLFTDVNMAGSFDGMDLAQLVHTYWPEIRIVVTSGKKLERSVPDDGKFVPKPYDVSRVTQVIAEAAGLATKA
jgi:DNA-binding NtrC family response regulator